MADWGRLAYDRNWGQSRMTGFGSGIEEADYAGKHSCSRFVSKSGLRHRSSHFLRHRILLRSQQFVQLGDQVVGAQRLGKKWRLGEQSGQLALQITGNHHERHLQRQ